MHSKPKSLTCPSFSLLTCSRSHIPLYLYTACVSGVLSRVWLFATLWTVARQLLRPWNFPDKNPRVGCRFLLQGISLTQGAYLHLLLLPHLRQVLYHCTRHLGSPLLLIRSINYFNGEKVNRMGLFLVWHCYIFSLQQWYEKQIKPWIEGKLERKTRTENYEHPTESGIRNKNILTLNNGSNTEHILIWMPENNIYLEK